MRSTTGRTGASVRMLAPVRVVTLFSLAAASLYVTWLLFGVTTNPWLAIPYAAIEAVGLLQMGLLATQAWRVPADDHIPRDGSAVVDLIVTCTFHSADELERTLIGCRTVRHARRTVVVVRTERTELVELAHHFGVDVVLHEGNHVDAFSTGATFARSPFAAWLEAGQIPMPDLIDSMIGAFACAETAVVQSSVGLINTDSFAHLRSGRDEDAFRHHVAFPSQGSRGVAPWMGGGSIVRIGAIACIGGFDAADQASLSRALVRLHCEGWKSRYYAGHPVVRGAAPDSLGAYLMLRRRGAIESLRVFRTPENPITVRGLRLRHRIGHIALAATYTNSIRQLALVVILITTLATGILPFEASTSTWLALWAPTFGLGLLARRLLGRGTMHIGDWSRQGWRALTADLSAFASIVGLRSRRVAFFETAGSGLQAIGKLRLLSAVLLALDAALVARGLTLIWPRLLPRFSASDRVLVLGVGLVTVVAMVDVLQAAIRRRQRREQFRLTTDLEASFGDLSVNVIDLAAGGAGTRLPKGALAPELGDVRRLSIGVPVDGLIKTIDLTAAVRSVVNLNGQFRVGVQFLNVESDVREAVIEYCAIHHHTDARSPTLSAAPKQFPVANAHPKLTQAASVIAVALGIATLFFGPGAPPAFADAAAPASVCLESSTGQPLAGGLVSFTYDEAWSDMGVTGADGCLTGPMPAQKTRIAMEHRGIRNQKRQNLEKNPVVRFATTPLTIGLTTSEGEPIAGALVEHRASEWTEVGVTDESGSVTVELLPKAKYRIAVNHDGVRAARAHDTELGPIARFTTTPVTTQVTDSTGVPLEGATVEYHNGSWQPFGVTDVEGRATTELLPKKIRFRVEYAGTRSTMRHDILASPLVEFATTAIVIELTDSAGKPLAGGEASYRARGWWPIGRTDETGVAITEIFPSNRTVRVTYDGASKRIRQDLTVNPTLSFATVALVPDPGVEVIEYRAGIWRPFERGVEVLGTSATVRLADGTRHRVELAEGATTFVPSGVVGPVEPIPATETEPVLETKSPPTTMDAAETTTTTVPNTTTTTEAQPTTTGTGTTTTTEAQPTTTSVTSTTTLAETTTIVTSTTTLAETTTTTSITSTSAPPEAVVPELGTSDAGSPLDNVVTTVPAEPATVEPVVASDSNELNSSAPAREVREVSPTVDDTTSSTSTDVPEQSRSAAVLAEPGIIVESAAVATPIEWSTPSDIATRVLDVIMVRADVTERDDEGASVTYGFLISNDTETELASGTVVEFSVNGIAGAVAEEQPDWSCASSGTTWRCAHHGPVTAGTSSVIRFSADVPPPRLLTVAEHRRGSDLAVLTLAVLAMLVAISAPQRLVFARAQRRSDRRRSM